MEPISHGTMKGHLLRNVGLVILLAIVVGGVLFYHFYLSGGIANVALGAISSNQQSLKSMILEKITSAPQLSLSFAGTISRNVTPTGGADPLVTLPFTVQYLKYYNDSRISLSMAGNQLIGINSLSAVAISSDNGTRAYACYDLNGAGYTCALGTGNASQIVSNLSSELKLGSFGNFKLGSITPSESSGRSCWSASGTANVWGNSTLFDFSNATLAFNTCIDSEYYFPIYLNATISQQNSTPTVLRLAMTNISQATNQSEITNLPGPLVNGT